MVLSYPVFFTIYAATMAAAVFIGILLLVGWKDMDIRKTLRSVKYNAVYIIIIAAFPMFVQLQDIVEHTVAGPGQTTNEIIYTNWMLNLAGGTIRFLQDRLDYRILTDIFIVAYAWLFALLAYLPPVLLLARDDRATMRQYAIAIMLNYIVLTPFYFLFPVSVTGSHPEAGLTPQLYVSTHWGKMVTSVDPLNNDFPSGHVSLSVTTLLVFAYAGAQYRRFSVFLAGATAAIVFSVLCLGVHWPADVLAGFLLAVGATVGARAEKVQMTIDRYVRAINQRLFREPGDKPGPKQAQH